MLSRLPLLLLLASLADAGWAQQPLLGATAAERTVAFRGQLGRRLTYVCPAASSRTAAIWGTDVYSDDSALCTAAIHAGVLTAGSPGTVTIVIGGAAPVFKGSARNGVTSRDYASHPGSFTFDRGGQPGQVDWKTTAQGLPAGYAPAVVVTCPPQGALQARVWGTDLYTEDSAICVAAVHAGIVTAAAGGPVAVNAAPGQTSYAASERHSVKTLPYRALGASFRVSAVGGAFIGPAPARQVATTVVPTTQPVPVTAVEGTVCGSTFANLCATAVDPASIRLRWAARTDATHYGIRRGEQVLATIPATAREYLDEGLDPGQTASYSVDALRAAGSVDLGGGPTLSRAKDGGTPAAGPDTGASLTRFATLETTAIRSATTPTLATPTNVTAQSVAGPKGRVRVAWAPVPGANGYLVYRDGNALPAEGSAATTESRYDDGVPLGRHRYQVEALFTTATSRRTVHGEASGEVFAEVVFPRPAIAFLSRPGGPSAPEELDAHFRTRCSGERALRDINECAKVVEILDQHTNFTANWKADLQGPGEATGFPGPNWTLASFADVGVLGLGRRVNCAPRREPTGPILCWATSHGSIPAPGATVDGAALAGNGERVQKPKSVNVILMYPDGRSFFGTWENPSDRGGVTPFDREFNFATAAQVRFGTPLDSQGVKPVPHACLSCHGGSYDPTSRMVVGASLLPLVPAQLAFSSAASRAAQEEAIRRINEIVLASNPAPAIVAQITALYGGNPRTAGTRASDTAVPAGWRSEPNVYRQVIEPYCAACHFSRQGALSFASVADARALRAAIQNSVCTTYTMPHSEAQFRRFWTEGGNVSLPGLLSTWLGFNTCGP